MNNMSNFTRRQFARRAPGPLLLSLASRGSAAPAAPAAPGAVPSRIVLTWTGDPARTQAVTWRTEVAAASPQADRKSTRLNSSHLGISYAVFCLKKERQHS